MPCFSICSGQGQGARLGIAMSDPRIRFRLAVATFACLAAGGCSMFRHDAKPATPAAPVAAASAVSHAPTAAPQPASAPPVAASSPGWGLVAVHLNPETMVGQTWTFPSADPLVYRDNRFVFKRDHLEASNAREHVVGTWSVESDKLCVTLHPGTSGTACYYVTGTPPADLRIRVLPDGDRVPLRIQ
jgi:hypothetical protein